MSNIIEQITGDRMIARQERDTATYQILTQIVGTYQQGAGLKKPKVGDNVAIEIIREIIAGNNTSLKEMRERNENGVYDEKILFLETQSEMLGHYLPTLLTEDELREILSGGEFANIGEFQKHLRENFTNRFQPGVAAQVFNSSKG